ncbi:hypothetical protein [Thiomicrospira sp. WB1]|uniref:hypothetical protein n=1 Tax=Thiomicrospira sp. WB1 TaxID=1685380 RepID=UPI000746A0AC|nr:hypothetical protein [Thiomicrospira sp. WB1]KUJ72277.1 hypothetical protein AVO41_00190 [Thiomicrospira sp. WB1]
MKKSLFLPGLVIFALAGLSACSGPQKFAKKPGQSMDQFRADQLYCKQEALGQWENEQGVSSVQVRSQKAVPLTYTDCMIQLGYERIERGGSF